MSGNPLYHGSGCGTHLPCCLSHVSTCSHLQARFVPGLEVSAHQTLWLPLHLCALHRDRASPDDLLRALTKPQAYALGQLLPRDRAPGHLPTGTRLVFVEHGGPPTALEKEQLHARR